MSYHCSIVDVEILPAVWEDVKDRVELALKKGNCSLHIEELYSLLLENSNEYKLFVALDSGAGSIVGVFTFFLADKRLIQLTTSYSLAGKEREVMDKIAAMARKVGATCIVGVGRKGWERVAPKLGWSFLNGEWIYALNSLGEIK